MSQKIANLIKQLDGELLKEAITEEHVALLYELYIKTLRLHNKQIDMLFRTYSTIMDYLEENHDNIKDYININEVKNLLNGYVNSKLLSHIKFI